MHKSFLFVIICISVGLAMTACAGPAATFVPPTSTPVPATATPAPTATASPTPTHQPTATAIPSPTPDLQATVDAQVAAAIQAIPTQTPLPTYTPVPTPTTTPTPEPTATSVPTPTPTLTPTPEAAPTALPTATPTQTATPTPSPTPKPLSHWKGLDRRTDTFTDEVSVSFYTRATEYTKGDYSDARPWLLVRCTPLKDNPFGTERIDIWVDWSRYMGAIDDFRGKLRWDDGEAQDSVWNESTDNEATFFSRFGILSTFGIGGSDKRFLTESIESSTLRVRIWDWQGVTYDATFKLLGLEQQLKDNADLCGWP